MAGWGYGVHWKRVASGDLFTADERMMIRLQDQIGALSDENEHLHARIRELEGEPGEESESPAIDIGAPALPGNTVSPLLPAPPQRIETH